VRDRRLEFDGEAFVLIDDSRGTDHHDPESFRAQSADRLSRVYSYDALGSWALVPLGYAIAGPVSEAIGTRPTLMAAAGFSLLATVAVLFVPGVRHLRRRGQVHSTEPSLVT
jgi:hypothetical protein